MGCRSKSQYTCPTTSQTCVCPRSWTISKTCTVLHDVESPPSLPDSTQTVGDCTGASPPAPEHIWMTTWKLLGAHKHKGAYRTPIYPALRINHFISDSAFLVLRLRIKPIPFYSPVSRVGHPSSTKWLACTRLSYDKRMGGAAHSGVRRGCGEAGGTGWAEVVSVSALKHREGLGENDHKYESAVCVDVQGALLF